MSWPHEDPPTETWPVVAAADPIDDHRDDGLVDDEWTQPQRRSRLTIALVIALLVALGFLAGVFVGRTGAAFGPSGGGSAAATSSARPAP